MEATLLIVNPFPAKFLFLYPLKTENYRFSDIFKGYRKEILVRNELNFELLHW